MTLDSKPICIQRVRHSRGQGTTAADGAHQNRCSAKPSKVEAIKLASQYLKTFVADELENGKSHFTEDAASILKFHGSYQQDDRDLRRALKKEGKENAYQFMVRVRIVGGKLTADQYLACDHLAQTIGNGSLRITTRQEFQLHGVLKHDLQTTIRRINEALLSTLAACGDVERNVLCCPAPIHDPVRADLQADALRWASHCAPRSSSYWDIWLDGEKIESLPTAGDAAGANARRRSRRAASTARPTCRASSRRRSPCPKTIALISMPMTSGSWASSRIGELVGLQRPGRRRPGHDPQCTEDVPVPGRAALLRRPRATCSKSARRSSRFSAISAIAPTASGPGSSTSFTTGALPAFRAKVEEYLGHPLADPSR